MSRASYNFVGETQARMRVGQPFRLRVMAASRRPFAWFKPALRSASLGGWLAGLLLFLGAPASFALTLTNVTSVNVTPNGFSVVWSGSPNVTPAISIFADANGVTNLAGQLGLEYSPVHSGNPVLANVYARLQNLDHLTQQMAALGADYARVTGCTPGTTYYYKARLVDANGQDLATFPVSGPLPSVTTAVENSFVLQSQQLLLTLPGGNPAGSIITLSNTNTPSILAAVVGDGAGTNQAFFNLSDLLTSIGTTNYLPIGVQTFTAKVLGASTNGLKQTYALIFTTSFQVGGNSQFDLGTYVAVSLGTSVLRAGDSGSLLINLIASTTVTNLSFLLNLPTNRFTSLSVQGTVPQLGTPTLQFVGSNSVKITLPALHNQNLIGNQQVAQLNFTTAPNQASAFVPLLAQTLQGSNADGTPANNIASQSGQIVIIANQSLLNADMDPDGTRNLTLYGKIGSNYEVQYNTDFGNPSAWTDLYQVAPMTSLVQSFPGLDPNNVVIIYRAIEFFATPPIVEK